MKHNKTLRRGLGILISLIMCLGLLPVTALAEETSTNVEISEANFPDDTFREYVSKFDTNNDDALNETEIAKVTKMDLFGKSIFNLKGIEYFTNLETLLCGLNNLTSVDVSSNTNLRNLDIANNSVDTLVLNTGIQFLTCNNNKLKSLDVSNFNSLSTLNCGDNEMETLRVNSGLTKLSCYDNKLQQLDLSGNTNLEALYCQRNQLSYLNLGNTDITRIDAADNSYTITIGEDRTYDLSKLPGGSFDVNKVVEDSWSGGSVSGNILTFDPNTDSVTYDYQCKDGITVTFTLTTIDPEAGKIEINSTNFPDDVFRTYVSDNIDTNEDGYLYSNEIKAVTDIEVYDEFVIESLTGIEYFTELKELDCAGNQLTTLDISNNTKVEMLDCDNNSLTKLKIGKNESLTDLYCSYNQLTTLDVSQNTGLINLQCEDNNLTSLDLSKNKKLEYLSCNNNSLTKLDVSDLTALTELDCSENKLTFLDLSKNTSLTKANLKCSDNIYDGITLGEGRTFALSNLPNGFDVNRIRAGTLVGGLLSEDKTTLTFLTNVVTYYYDCGNKHEAIFTLDATPKYTITVTAEGNGTASASSSVASAGTNITLSATPDRGYRFKEWQVTPDTVIINDNQFTMPGENVTVTAVFEFSVAIDEANFPDENFRAYVSDEFDEDGNGYLDSDEIKAVTSINVYEKGIGDLTGISYFTNLNTLNCEDNNLTALDVSQNKNLRNLYCDSNQLTSLDVSQNTSLSYLKCSFNQLTSLNVSGAEMLTNLYCISNKLTYLDVSSNEYLSTLYCSGNQLTYLDLSNTQVSDLSASNNVYEITLNEGRTFDLSTLPGGKFNAVMVSSYDDSIGTIDKETAVLTLASGADEFTYSYNCGNYKYANFKLKVKSGGGDTDDTTKYTVTASGIYYTHYGNEPGETFTLSRAAGEMVVLPTGIREGYTLKDLTLVGISEKDITWTAEGVENEQRAIGFTMPANDVAITVNWTANGTGGGSSSGGSSGGGGGGGSVKKYSVTASENIENGTVTISPKNASAGSKVTVTVTPDEGYALESFVIKDENGKEIKLTDNGNGKYTFTMPSGKVTVEPSFKAETAEPVEPAEPAKSVNPFTDVPSGAYYEDAVIWAVEKGITSGTTETTFSPDASCTRAQMLTFMWRAAGSPKATGSNPFTDVSADAYYYDAVLWAVENGITSGISATTFAPDATVTRDQTVTFLYRAAGSPAANGSSFSDVSSDAYYADAVAWAVQQNITSGTGDNQFSPNADCTRAQIVTFLYRYMG